MQGDGWMFACGYAMERRREGHGTGSEAGAMRVALTRVCGLVLSGLRSATAQRTALPVVGLGVVDWWKRGHLWDYRKALETI